MESPEREQPPSHRIHVASQTAKERLDLERKILAAAFKICFESADSDGAALAHKGLMAIIQQQLFSGDGSSGSVIPKSIWQQAQAQLEAEQANADAGQPAAEAAPMAGKTEPVADELQPEPVTEALQPKPVAEELQPEPEEQQPEHVGEDQQPAEPDHSDLEIPTLTSEQLAELSQADPTAPLNYLDFGDDEEGAVDTSQAVEAAPEPVYEPEPPPVPMTPSQLIKTQTFYQILGVSQVAVFEEIHTRFLRIMRKLLRNRYAAESSITDFREFREILRAICVAHDVLKDPVTRADYDLRQMGMRNEGIVETPVDMKPAATTRTRLMLGELLECAQILEAAELQIALDMHKAEPGIQFGEFLVSANFLNQDELECALLAQRLISMGKITVNQFRTGMYRMRDEGVAFFDTLMMEGWISPADVFDESSELWKGLNEIQQMTAAAPNTVHAGNQVEGNGTHPEVAEADQPEKNGEWTKEDSLAETQSINVAAFRSRLEERPE